MYHHQHHCYHHHDHRHHHHYHLQYLAFVKRKTLIQLRERGICKSQSFFLSSPPSWTNKGWKREKRKPTNWNGIVLNVQCRADKTWARQGENSKNEVKRNALNVKGWAPYKVEHHARKWSRQGENFKKWLEDTRRSLVRCAFKLNFEHFRHFYEFFWRNFSRLEILLVLIISDFPFL